MNPLARLVELTVRIPKPFVTAGQKCQAFAYRCKICGRLGPLHLLGWESAPVAAAYDDADYHINVDHGDEDVSA